MAYHVFSTKYIDEVFWEELQILEKLLRLDAVQ